MPALILPRVLFCSPCGPYPKAPVDRDPIDFFYYRNTLGQGLFQLRSFQSWYSLHFLAQNLPVPSVVLENPTMRRFQEEVEGGGYQVVAIGFTVITTARVLEMVSWLKRARPEIESHPGRLRDGCLQGSGPGRHGSSIEGGRHLLRRGHRVHACVSPQPMGSPQ